MPFFATAPSDALLRLTLPRAEAQPCHLAGYSTCCRRKGENVTETESAQLGQAAEIGGRLLANVETVVHGKTQEVRSHPRRAGL